jgi:two-component system cell cycle sensor histidine kinase/response regulator CckA
VRHVLGRIRFEWRSALPAILVQPLMALVVAKVPLVSQFPGLVFVVDALLASYYAGAVVGIVASAEVVFIGGAIGIHPKPALNVVNLTAAFLIAAVGGVVISRLFMRERTIRKEAAESEVRYRRLLEATFDAVVLSADGAIVQVSSGFERLWGYSPEDAVGHSLLEFIAPSSRSKVSERLSSRTDEPIELEIVTSEGEERTIRVVAQNVDYRGRPARLAAITDVTMEMEAAQERVAAEQRYRALFEAVPVGVTLATIDGVYLEANSVYCELVGRSRDEIVGHHFTEFTDPLTNRDPDILEAVRRGESGPFEFETAITAPSGTATPVRVGIAVVRDDDGTPLYSVTVNESIAERRELEAQIRQQQKMDAIGRLASGIAHDFNNLLTVIGGNVLLLGSSELAAEARRRVDEIGTAAERAGQLTRQLLTFSRSREPSYDELDLNELVQEVVDGMLRRLIGANVEVQTVISPAPLPLLADGVELEQVLINLAVNARDAMPNGGTLTIGTGRTADSVLLRVSDTGTGMDEGTRERIFEPFFTTKPRGEGTGLGLANVYGIVARMGGTIAVDSTPGEGTTFTVTTPASVTARPEEGTSSDVQGGTARVARVLVVDDEEAVRRVAGATLSRAGHEPILAADGNEALGLLTERAPIDLLITDLEMPGMNGLELAKLARATCPGLGVLFISGYPDRVLSTATDTGAIDLLEKPFSPMILLERVARALA